MPFGLIGAPSSAAGHWPGMEKAPAFLRLSGLPERLRESGAKLVDHGDLPQLRWRPDPRQPHAQNLNLVADFLTQVANRVDDALSNGESPIVIGGECAITLGAVAGFLRHHEDFGLIYLDGHLDLNTPSSTRTGVLDSMGVAHLFGLEGTTADLRDLGPRSPMLDPARVVFVGHNEDVMNPIEIEHLRRIEATTFPVGRLAGSALPLAEEALGALEDKVAAFAVHFDVDVICFGDFPIANVPIHNQGLTFEQAMECVEVFAASPKCVGIIITEINPDHSTEALGQRFAERLALALRPLAAKATHARPHAPDGQRPGQ